MVLRLYLSGAGASALDDRQRNSAGRAKEGGRANLVNPLVLAWKHLEACPSKA